MDKQVGFPLGKVSGAGQYDLTRYLPSDPLNYFQVGMPFKYGRARSTRRGTKRRAGRSFTQTQTKRKKTSYVTQQHDARLVYRRRPMPYRKKKNWKRFTRKVQAVLQKGLGSRQTLRNASLLMTAIAGDQAVAEITLYGVKGTSNTHDDISDIFATFGTDAQQQRKKIMFYSAVLDLTITNNGDSTEGVAEVDIYEFYMRKQMEDDNWLDRVTLSLSDQETMSGMSAYSIGTRGWTPFQACLALGYIRILKKQKFFVGTGQAITYQIRDPANRYFNGQHLSDSFTNWVGKTRGVIIVAKGLIDGTGTGRAVDLAVGYTKAYNFTVDETADAGKGVF